MAENFSFFMAWYFAGLAFHLFLSAPIVGILVCWRAFRRVVD